ncbi:MAG TPA: hypothetical protein VIO32_09735 [Candidatus Baltobacteraceae bacterium]
MQLTVHAVLVPPLKCGIAYAHTDAGRCVQFSGERHDMIALCEEVKAFNYGRRGPVCVNAGNWRELSFLTQDDCPGHASSAA